MDVKKLGIKSPEWFAFVEAHPDSTIFHHPAWAGLIAECYGYRPFVITVTDKSGEIAAALPMMELRSLLQGKRWISLPFSDYCPPLLRDGVSLSLLAQALIGLRREHGVPSVEVRSSLQQEHGVHLSTPYVIHSLHLQTDPTVVFDGFDRKFRQYPRKAEREGLTARASSTREDIDIFYAIHLKTRVKLGVPVQPKRFFDLLWHRMIAKGLGIVIIVKEGSGIPISGAIVLRYRQNAMIKFSGSDPAYLYTRCHYFTFWKCIEWACMNGVSVFDFGRTEVPEVGLRKFKDGWGAKEEPLTYSTISRAAPRQSSGRSTKLIRGLIQHSPPLVCRAIGELFYRYAA
jgi:CelD/BcsL family acetyltransferase involved in cellulose biosynthesis